MELDKSINNCSKVTEIWEAYHKELDEPLPGVRNIYEGIVKAQPNYQSEILQIMYNEGYKAGLEAGQLKEVEE